jgi:hypothetical protein
VVAAWEKAAGVCARHVTPPRRWVDTARPPMGCASSKRADTTTEDVKSSNPLLGPLERYDVDMNAEPLGRWPPRVVSLIPLSRCPLSRSIIIHSKGNAQDAHGDYA